MHTEWRAQASAGNTVDNSSGAEIDTPAGAGWKSALLFHSLLHESNGNSNF